MSPGYVLPFPVVACFFPIFFIHSFAGVFPLLNELTLHLSFSSCIQRQLIVALVGSPVGLKFLLERLEQLQGLLQLQGLSRGLK